MRFSGIAQKTTTWFTGAGEINPEAFVAFVADLGTPVFALLVFLHVGFSQPKLVPAEALGHRSARGEEGQQDLALVANEAKEVP